MNRAISVSVVTGLNIAIAIGIQFYVLLYFGVGPDTDAHVASQTLPVLAGSLLTATLPQALVPILIAQQDPTAAAWVILRRMAFIAIPVVVALTVLVPMWVPMLFFGLDQETLALAADLSRIQMATVVASAMLAAPLARLYADHRVLSSEVSFLFASLVTIALLPLLSHRFGIRGASCALLLRPFLQLAGVLVSMGRSNGRVDARDLIATVWQRVRPLAGSAPLYKLGPVADRVLGSLTQSGQLTLLIYGQHVWNFGLTLVDRVFGKPLLATVSREIHDGHLSRARSAYLSQLRWVGVLTMIVLAGFWWVGEAVLHFVSGFTHLSESNASELYTMCLLLGGVLIAGGLGQMSLAVVYSLGDTRAVTRIAIVSFAAATALKVVLLPMFGIMGIAVGAVCYQVVNLIALHRCVLRALR